MTCMGHGCWSTDDHCSCVQDHAFSTSLMTETETRKKKKQLQQHTTLLLTKWCQRQILLICVYIFIYLSNNLLMLFVWFKIWALAASPLICCKCYSVSSRRHIRASDTNPELQWPPFRFFFTPFKKTKQNKNAVITKSLMYICNHKTCTDLLRKVRFVWNAVFRWRQLGPLALHSGNFFSLSFRSF